MTDQKENLKLDNHLAELKGGDRKFHYKIFAADEILDAVKGEK